MYQGIFVKNCMITIRAYKGICYEKNDNDMRGKEFLWGLLFVYIKILNLSDCYKITGIKEKRQESEKVQGTVSRSS